MKIRPVGEVLYADGQTLIVAFHSFANTPKSGIDCRNYIY